MLGTIDALVRLAMGMSGPKTTTGDGAGGTGSTNEDAAAEALIPRSACALNAERSASPRPTPAIKLGERDDERLVGREELRLCGGVLLLSDATSPSASRS